MVKRYYADQDAFYQHFAPTQFEKERPEYERGLWDTAFAYETDLLGHWGYLCDIGAGMGWFIRYWNELGDYCAWGIEPSAHARNVARYRLGLTLLYPDWQTLWQDEHRRYPLLNTTGHTSIGITKMHHVRLCLVLEHVADPLAFLKEIASNLRELGNLLIIVPNEMNPLQRCIQGKGDWWVSPVHVNYFTSDSLRTLLCKAGFIVQHESATFPIELFQLMGLTYIGHPRIGKLCHYLRLYLEHGLGKRIFNLYQWLYERYGWGRELIMLAQKKPK